VRLELEVEGAIRQLPEPEIEVVVDRAGEEEAEAANPCGWTAVDVWNRVLFRARPAPRSPVVVIVVAITAVTMMLWMVVPVFAKMFKDMDAELPEITQYVVNVPGQTQQTFATIAAVNAYLATGNTGSTPLPVPQAAIQVGQNGTYVFVVKPDNTAELRPVQVSRTVDGRAVIAKGLEPGEQVVTDGQLRLTNGSRIEIRSAQRSTKADAS